MSLGLASQPLFTCAEWGANHLNLAEVVFKFGTEMHCHQHRTAATCLRQPASGYPMRSFIAELTVLIMQHPSIFCTAYTTQGHREPEVYSWWLREQTREHPGCTTGHHCAVIDASQSKMHVFGLEKETKVFGRNPKAPKMQTPHTQEHSGARN